MGMERQGRTPMYGQSPAARGARADGTAVPVRRSLGAQTDARALKACARLQTALGVQARGTRQGQRASARGAQYRRLAVSPAACRDFARRPARALKKFTRARSNRSTSREECRL